MLITFNDLPQVMTELFVEVKEIKALLKGQTTKVETQPSKLTLDRAVTYLNGNGYPVTKSRLYKLTATNSVPVQRFGSRLVFDASELLRWCADQTTSQENSDVAIESVAMSANKKINRTVSYI
jgi:hypothetical protein